MEVRVPRICFLNQELLIMELVVEEPPSHQLNPDTEVDPGYAGVSPASC